MSGKRFLLVMSRPPWPPTSGGGQRSNLMFRALSELGQVDLVLVDFEVGDVLLQKLEAEFGLVGYFPPRRGGGKSSRRQTLGKVLPGVRHLLQRWMPNRRLSRWLANRVATQRYHLVVARFLNTAARAGLFGLHPLVVDVDDLEPARLLSQLAVQRTSAFGEMRIRLEALLMTARLRRQLLRCDHVWINRTEDMRVLPHERYSLLPNVPFDGAGRRISTGEGPPDSASVLFVGHLGYAVNVRALEHFVSEVWPRVVEQCPDAVLRIVGSGGERSRLDAWSRLPNVAAPGYVEDLADVYETARFAICPIKEGAGTKIKVLEALSHQRTCVVTAHSHRGFEDTLIDGESLLVADSDDEFARHCIRLLGDHRETLRLARAGAAAVSRHFSYDVFRASVQKAVLELADECEVRRQ